MPPTTKLTKKLQDTIVENLKLGNYIETSCEAAGIHTTTYQRWLRQGEAGEEPFHEFYLAVKQARAEAEEDLLKIIRNASLDGSWQAACWILERTKPRQFSRTTKIEGGDNDHPIKTVVNIVSFEAEAESLEKTEEATK